ncbi:MAG: hypothetical protein R2826_11525 [Thermoleophilia bacterium]
MKRYRKHFGLLVVSAVMLLAMSVPALATPASNNAAEHGLHVWSMCWVSSGGYGTFTFDATSEPAVTGLVVDPNGSNIQWSGALGDVKMNQGWDRVKAKVIVKVWGTIQNYGYVPASSPLDGVFSFDFTGVVPTELVGGDFALNEFWVADGEWTIMVPSIPIEPHELGCFGYNFHTGDDGFYASLHKWLSR